MNKRPIDRTKKSNIKCEHCLYGERPKECWQEKYWCALHQVEKNYWNSCKGFEWRKDD